MMSNNKRLLITGGSGFIGTNAVDWAINCSKLENFLFFIIDSKYFKELS